MEVTSPSFIQNGMIPQKFTCDGSDVNPALELHAVPQETQSLTLIVDDPDAPGGTFDHWIVYDIPLTSRIEEDSIPGKQGMNDFRNTQYGGPCPPSGTHRYFFKVYALDQNLRLPQGKRKRDVQRAMQGHILANAALVGRYNRT